MPEFSPQVVVNATPIISLALISQIDLLHQFYGKVIIPPAVQSEVLAGGPQGVGRVGLILTGTLGILLKAKERGFILQVAPLIEQLRLGGIRLGDRVVAETLKLADEL